MKFYTPYLWQLKKWHDEDPFQLSDALTKLHDMGFRLVEVIPGYQSHNGMAGSMGVETYYDPQFIFEKPDDSSS